MNICPNCGFKNPEGIHICLNCASSLKLMCQKCNAEIPPGNRFCGQCGAPVAATSVSRDASASNQANMNMQERMMRDLISKMPTSMVNKFVQGSRELYGQRREVTVLDVEIADFQTISRDSDSETLYFAVDAIIHILADIVYKYEGTIDKYSGNGLMALFGLPINHENDPERAVRAALEMQNRLGEMGDDLLSRYQHVYQLRIGVNSGEVIAGYMSDQQHMEYTVIGDTVRLASSLCKAARAGGTLVSFNTYQRTRPILDYQVLPASQVEEIAEPVRSFRPLGVRLVPGQVRGLPGLQVPMIGRRRQLDQLIEAYKLVVANNSSQVILCSGEAGIGKSRLVAEFRQSLTSRPVAMVQGTCAVYMRITPYRVLADVLRNLLGISELNPIHDQRSVLRQRLVELGLDRDDILPFLMHVLGILHADPVSEVRIKLLDPSMLLRQTHFALRMFFIAESRRMPLVLVFDDLHWVDQPSGQFLEYLCQSLGDNPILLLMVARDFTKFTFVQSVHTAALKLTHKPLEIDIQPLTNADAQLLVNQLLHEDTEQAKEMKTLITARAGGNPYYTEELVRVLLDNGGLVETGGEWHLTASAARLIREVPGTLSDIILARFDHLPDALKNVLLRASVLGDSFSVRLLQSLVNNAILDLPSALAELEERDFLIHTQFDIEDGYIFKHPLVQETIYKTLLKRDSKKLHLQVAQAIEAGNHWLPGERNQVLAYHLSESSKPAAAIPYLLISAERAYQHFANATVVNLYTQVLALMDAVDHVPLEQKQKAQVGLAQALKFTGELDAATRLLLEIVEQIPNNQSEQGFTAQPTFQVQIEALRELADIRAREGDLDFAVHLLKRGMELLSETGRSEYPVIWRRLADRLAWVYFRQRNFDEAYNLADLALLNTAAHESEDPITMASLYNTIGGIYWSRSRFAEAIESVEQSLEIYKNLHYHWGMAISLANLGILHYSTEKWSQAVEYLERADQLRREYGDDPERPTSLRNLGEVLIDLGDHQRARRILETSREISQRLGLTLSETYAEFGLCRLALIEERGSDAIQHLSNAGHLIESLDEDNERVAEYFQLQAQIDGLNGKSEQARVSAERALLVSQRGDISEKQVDALRILGRTCARQGEYDEAVQFLNRSIELAQQLDDRFSEAKARYELGTVFKQWGEVAPARHGEYYGRAINALDAAIWVFETLGAKHDLMLAKRVRAQLAQTAATYIAPPPVSPGEMQPWVVHPEADFTQGEWYQATIVSVMLTAQPGQDDELIFETIAFLVPAIIELVQENGCRISRLKDGFTAIFGVPVIHEDDPERAIDTVMQVVNFYHDLDQQTDLPISFHIGVSSGRIVASKTGLEPLSEWMAAGEPVQIARQIAEVCPPGRVWATHSVYNLTSFRFEYQPVTESAVERLGHQVIYQLEGLREQILPVRGLIGLKTPFIGRDRELDEMDRMSAVLKGDTGGIVWIEGEAGIGKSRLMREYSKRVGQYHALVLNGVCTARHSSYAFSLFSDVLMHVFDIQPHYTPRQINEQIDRKVSEWSVDLDEVRPFLQLLLGVQPSGAQGERITSMEPEQLRRQTFVAIHHLFGVLASRQPLVFILDDVQWIDSISADLLLYLSHLVVARPILLVCAYRQNEECPFDAVLGRVRSTHPDQYIHLAIRPLTIDECRLLLNEFLASAELPESFLSLIIQQSGGNPYFIEEFVRLLVEQDFLRLERGKLVASRTLEADAMTVPASLESLIRARVDSLDNSSRQLLQVASVIGHRFNSGLLAQVMEREDVHLLLPQLQTRGMMQQTIEEEGYWEFSHPLIEIIVYNTVLRAQRRILHQRTALALEKQWRGREDEHAEDLAYHFRKAEVYDRALHYLILAGERATLRHANDVAVSFFEQAAELLSAVPNVGDEVRWRIIHQLGEVYQFIGNYDTSLVVLQSGQDLLSSKLLSPAQRAGICRRMGDTAHKKGDQEQAILYLQQALELIGEPADNPSNVEAALIYARLGWCYFQQSDYDPAKEAVMRSMQYAGAAKNLTTLAMAENHLGGILFRQGDLEQAMQHTRTAMNYWQEIGYSWGVAAALSNLGILESVSGNWQAAYNSIKRSLDLRQKMGDVDGVAITNHNLGQLARSLGDVDQAEQYYRDSLAVSRPFQMNWHAANSYVGLAQSLLNQRKLDEASEAVQESQRLAQEINAPDVTVEACCTLAEIQLVTGNLDAMEISLDKAVRLASQIGVSPLLATAWRLTSLCKLRQGNVEGAVDALENGWLALDEGPDRIEEGRLHVQAMQLALHQGDRGQALAHYQAAERVFQDLGAARELAQLQLAFIR